MMNNNYKNDFPVLKNTFSNGKPLIYFDNSATTQKPYSVIEAVTKYYTTQNANIHRGVYSLSAAATDEYEAARQTVADFIGAARSEEIIFTSGTTASINHVAYSYGLNFIGEGDEILITIAEHHSNMLPWQMVAKQTGAKLNYLYIDEQGEIPPTEIEAKINKNTKLVAFAHVSNVLGIVNPVKIITEKAHAIGAAVLLDAAQSIAHLPIDVQDLNVDFLAFSGHKMFAPMGTGVLYGKKALLEKMPPFMSGGGTIDSVSEQTAVFTALPERLEAGTPNVEGVLGLKAAVDYINTVGYNKIQETEHLLTDYALGELAKIPEVTVYGSISGKKRVGVISFNIKDAHPHDVATILDYSGIAIRAGHHCAHPLMKFWGENATCRASFCFYNTKAEIDVFINAVKNVRKELGLEPK